MDWILPCKPATKFLRQELPLLYLQNKPLKNDAYPPTKPQTSYKIWNKILQLQSPIELVKITKRAENHLLNQGRIFWV